MQELAEQRLHYKQIRINMYNQFGQIYQSQTLREKCPYSEIFWSVFSRIRTEYREIPSISPYSVQMWENTDQKNSEFTHFPRSEILQSNSRIIS